MGVVVRKGEGGGVVSPGALGVKRAGTLEKKDREKQKERGERKKSPGMKRRREAKSSCHSAALGLQLSSSQRTDETCN